MVSLASHLLQACQEEHTADQAVELSMPTFPLYKAEENPFSTFDLIIFLCSLHCPTWTTSVFSKFTMESHDPMDIDRPVNTPPLTFNQKWEIHKALLERLYLEENLNLPKISGIMHDQHQFDAEFVTLPIVHTWNPLTWPRIHQYKYRFNKWGWKKSLSSETKARIVSKSQQRLKSGHGTVAKYKARDIDSRKLVRYEKAQAKKQASAVLFAPNTGGSKNTFAFNGIAGDRM
jgi:hypothetical protein